MNDSEPIIDFLQKTEELWSNELASVSLVAEFDVDSATALKALKYLGIKYRGLNSEANFLDRRSLLKAYPAIFLVSTVNLIVEEYNNGGIWPQLAEAVGVSNSQTLHSDWGDAFLHNLQKLNLPTFRGVDNLKQHYVSRMTLHSGIPTSTMDDYFRIISEQLAKDPDITAEELVSWAQDKIATETLYNVDVPVKQFIVHGKEFCIDLTDRCIELLSRIGEGGSISGDVALPSRFTEEATRLMQDGRIRRISSRTGKERSARPRFILDPHSYVPSLYLPSSDALDSNDSVVWNIAFGEDEPLQISAPSLWPGEPSPERVVPLPKPVRQAAVSLNSSSYSTKTIGFIDGSNPMIFFDESGAILPRGVDLPSGNVWVLVPGELAELEADANLRGIASVQLPTGWDRWTLSLVDLVDATYIKHARSGTERQVRSLGSAKILTDSPLLFVKSLTGSPVYSSKPTIILPEDSEWEVILMNSVGTELHRIRTVEDEDIASLWSEELGSVIGEYTIKIRGPLGRGTTRTLYIAEGLTESSTHSFRQMRAGGLDVASVRLVPPDGMDTEKTIHFDSDTIEKPTTVASHRFRVSIPYTCISYDGSSPSTQPITLFTEDIRELPALLQLHTSETDPAFFEVQSNGVVVQREVGLGYMNGSYRFNLAKIAETLDQHPYVTITFGDERTRLATVRPKSLFDEARLSPDRTEVLFSECADVHGLSAVFYNVSAPWAGPRSAPVSDSRCQIPDDFRAAGDLLVFLKVADEWTGHDELPEWPSNEKIAHLDNTGWYSAGNEEETTIATFISGNSKSLPAPIDDIGLLWVVYARTMMLYESKNLNHVDGRLVVSGINKALERQVRDALIAIAQSPLENRMIPYVLISSGMVWSRIDIDHEATSAEWSIRNSLPSTLLSAADSEWSDNELSAAVNVIGASAMDVYNGKDPYSTAGGFGIEVNALDADPSRQKQIFDSLNLIPEGLLHADSRAKASLLVFSLRHDDRIRWMVDHSGDIVANTRTILRRIAPKEVINLYESRLHPFTNEGWHGLPAASLGLALLARYASRDNKQAKDFFEIEGQEESVDLRDILRLKNLRDQRQGWADFAKLAPDMATIDIVLAELVIAGAEKRKEQKHAE